MILILESSLQDVLRKIIKYCLLLILEMHFHNAEFKLVEKEKFFFLHYGNRDMH